MNIFPGILPGKTNRNGKVNIKIRIIHNGESREIGTKFYIDPKYFLSSGMVSDELPGYDYINVELQKLVLNYNTTLLKVNWKQLHVNRIVEILKDENFVNSDFLAYFRKVIVKKSKVNRRTGEIYQATLDKVEKFEIRRPLLFENITEGWLKDFRDEEKSIGNSKATISIHLRNIRAVINDAIDNREIPLSLYPFRRFQIQSGSDEKTPLTLNQLKKLIALHPETKGQENAKNALLLSFCLIGMNSSDMMDCLDRDVKSGRLRYERNKSKKKLNIKLEPEALEYIEKLKGKDHLLNFSARFKNAKTFSSSTNQLLKPLGDEIGMENLMMYTARHTWASLAKNLLGVEDNDIAAALSHSVGGVTQAYIHRNQEYIDKINRDLLDIVFKEPVRRTRKKKEVKSS